MATGGSAAAAAGAVAVGVVEDPPRAPTGLFAVYKQHDLAPSEFSEGHHCDSCLKPLWPTGLLCSRCGVSCHQHCKDQLQETRCHTFQHDGIIKPGKSVDGKPAEMPEVKPVRRLPPTPARPVAKIPVCAPPATGSSPAGRGGRPLPTPNHRSRPSESTSTLRLTPPKPQQQDRRECSSDGEESDGEPVMLPPPKRAAPVPPGRALPQPQQQKPKPKLQPQQQQQPAQQPQSPVLAAQLKSPELKSLEAEAKSPEPEVKSFEAEVKSPELYVKSPEPDASSAQPPSAAEEKEARMRRKAVEELVESEGRYVEDLCTLLTAYVSPLRDSSKFPAFERKDVQIVFSTVELIHQGNAALLADLRKALEETPDTAVGDTFLKLEDNLQFYSVFCNHQEEARSSMEHIIASSSNVRDHLERVRNEQTRGLGLLDYFVKPFQRLLKYPLLLNEIIRHTPQTHPDHTNLVRAQQSLQRVVDRINLAKAHSENMRRLVSVCSSVAGLANFTNPQRRFLREGDVLKAGESRMTKRHIFLFNDYLLVCKPQSLSNKYALKHSVPLLQADVAMLSGYDHEDLDEATVRKVRDNSACSFVVHATSVHKHWIFVAKTEEECTSWVKAIQAQVQLLLTFVRKPTEEPGAAPGGPPAQGTGVIRVYGKVDQYRTFDIARKLSAKEFVTKYGHKIVKNADGTPAAPPEGVEVKLILFDKGNERELDDKEIPLDIQTNLMSTGVQFGTPETHFRISTGNYGAAWTLHKSSSAGKEKHFRGVIGRTESVSSASGSFLDAATASVASSSSEDAASPSQPMLESPPTSPKLRLSPPLGSSSAPASPAMKRGEVSPSVTGSVPTEPSMRKWIAGDYRSSRGKRASQLLPIELGVGKLAGSSSLKQEVDISEPAPGGSPAVEAPEIVAQPGDSPAQVGNS